MPRVGSAQFISHAEMNPFMRIFQNPKRGFFNQHNKERNGLDCADMVPGAVGTERSKIQTSQHPPLRRMFFCTWMITMPRKG
ncbi:hypothetical protein BBD40_19835 [Paenibacillus ihbetae]|uniref:Uncharacterized protein n=1 Tax=Paenibacillus ihbetae TaxID=1870820 RepID=A0ABX3K3C4_9BACL|nr:hypothetical protein BBD40_19835 [Paenibacillus ihbetae]